MNITQATGLSSKQSAISHHKTIKCCILRSFQDKYRLLENKDDSVHEIRLI